MATLCIILVIWAWWAISRPYELSNGTIDAMMEPFMGFCWFNFWMNAFVMASMDILILICLVEIILFDMPS
jgi:hypothetical protein